MTIFPIDYYPRRLSLPVYEDDKRFHVREKLDEMHLTYSVSFSDTFGWPSLSFAVYVMFDLPTICLTITRNGQEERTIAP